MLPAYTVEKSGFVKMLAKFNPRYDLPNRNYLVGWQLHRCIPE